MEDFDQVGNYLGLYGLDSERSYWEFENQDWVGDHLGSFGLTDDEEEDQDDFQYLKLFLDVEYFWDLDNLNPY